MKSRLARARPKPVLKTVCALTLAVWVSFAAQASEFSMMTINTFWLWDERAPNEAGNQRRSRFVAPYAVRLQAIARKIKEHKPTLVALQEVENRLVAEDIARLSGGTWHIHATDSLQRTAQDVALLSRLPLLESGTLGYPRKFLYAIVEINGVPIVIGVTHLISRRTAGHEKIRALQSDAVAKSLSRSGVAHRILAGDFNAPFSELKAFKSDYTVPKELCTYEFHGKCQSLSHIFSTNNVRLDDYKTLFFPKKVTDHRGLVAKIIIKAKKSSAWNWLQ